MGSSSSKPQYYYTQSGSPLQGSHSYPSQGQFGYYYQQVGNDPTKVQAIPGYYYHPTQRPTHRKHNSTSPPSNTQPRSPRRKNHAGNQAAVASGSSPPAAPPAQSVESTEPPTNPADPSEASPQAPADAPTEPPKVESVPENEHVEPTPEPEPEPEPASEPAPVHAVPGLTNPLPNPPRDVFDTDPYRHLRRAQTAGTTGTWHYYNAPIASVSYKPHLRSQYRPKRKETLRPPRPHEELKRKEKKSNGIGGGTFGILRAFTMPSLPTNKTKKVQHPPAFYQPGVAYAYPHPTSGSQPPNPILAAATTAPPALSGSPIVVPLDSSLNPTSSHKILYKKKLYPSAAHLFEAQKFLKHSPELAERIRTSSDRAVEMSMMSRAFQADGKVRSDWPLVWRDKLDEVLYMKFTQHPDLRAELMATGYAPLLDGNEVRQPDADGVNELGKALVRLRERMRKEGAR